MTAAGRVRWGKHRIRCYGRRADTPLASSGDNRQSLSSGAQYRAGYDHGSLDTVCSPPPCNALAKLATGRDDHSKCGRLYSSLFAFEVRADLHENRIFHMDHTMIPDLPGRATIWASSIRAAERLAEMNCCGAVRAEFAGNSEFSGKDLLISFERMGYSLAGVRVFKRLEAKSVNSGDEGDRVVRSPRGPYDA